MLLLSVRSFLRRQGLPGTGPRYALPESTPPLFARKVPWWINWAYGLLAVDLIVTTSAIELTWNYWTIPTPALPVDSGSKSKPEPDSAPEWTLRNTWERGALCTGHFIMGVVAASALLVARARHVRTLHILPPITTTSTIPASPPLVARSLPKRGKGKAKPSHIPTGPDERRVFLQTGIDVGRVGLVWPIKDCSLQIGRDNTELILRVASEKGHWYIGINDQSVIDGGFPSDTKAARDMILQTWRPATVVGKLEDEQRKKTTGGWASGPAAQSIH